MAAFKDQIDQGLARDLAREMARAWPEFPERRFTRGVAAALAPLELLARVDELARRLAVTLPPAFGDAAGVLWKALESDTFTGWMTLACGTFVAHAGLDRPEVALPLLAGLTPRWSSEWTVRPFIEAHPVITYSHLRRWATDPDEHVRRLVSETTRPRLPWAPVLRSLVEDPTPNIELLDVLVVDPSVYVRRSVANHLNDIAKDHPDLALELAARWDGRGELARWAVRHGLRTLVKRGDPRALALLGVEADVPVELLAMDVTPSRLTIGEAATFTVDLVLADDHPEPADVVVDYRVHYQGARGVNAPKVFKLVRRRLEPGRPAVVSRSHRFEHVSIRRIRPGAHTIDVQVNGKVLGSVVVEVVEPPT